MNSTDRDPRTPIRRDQPHGIGVEWRKRLRPGGISSVVSSLMETLRIAARNLGRLGRGVGQGNDGSKLSISLTLK